MYGLGCETEWMISSLEGEVLTRDGYVVARWPQLPDYRGGSFIAFPRAPQPGNLAEWDTLWQTDLDLKHRNFAWSKTLYGDGDVTEFLGAGYKRSHTTVFEGAAGALPERANRDVVVRALASESEWEQAVANQVYDDGWGATLMSRYRALSERARGGWFGAFDRNDATKLLASCGLFVGDNGVARYQSVATNKDVRGRGIATALVATVATLVEADSVVITASAHSKAERVYRSLGWPLVDEMLNLLRV